MVNYAERHTPTPEGKQCWLRVQATHLYALKISSAGMKENLGVTKKHGAVLFRVRLPCETSPSREDRLTTNYWLDLKVQPKSTGDVG